MKYKKMQKAKEKYREEKDEEVASEHITFILT